MATITGTMVGQLDASAGQYKIIQVTAPIESASDQIVLTAAAHGGAKSIVGILGAVITGGMDADFMTLQVSFSGLTLTIVSKEADGSASDEWTGTTVAIAVIVAVE